MTNIHKSSRNYFFVSQVPELLNDLPPLTYGLRYSGDHGLYLEEIEAFDMPSKVYGDITPRANRIVNTYKDRKNVTGVLLCGEKGSGKTLLGKQVALDLQAQGQPIIVVNMAVNGDLFGTFLQRLGKPVTLFFDEFEKVYPPKEQEGLLTILDGVYPVKALAILTSNSTNLADALINRPGRIFYSLSYDGLDYTFAEEYTRDKLKDTKRVEEVLRLVTMATINFDQLQAIIEEMNRYDESALDAVQMLNIDTTVSGGSCTVLSLITPDGVEVNMKDAKSDRVYLDYGNSAINYITPNHKGLTFTELRKEVGHFWGHFAATWPELGMAIKEERGDEVAPFMPGYINIEMDFDEESTEAKPTIKAAPNNCIAYTGADGHRALLKRNKVQFRKSF